jgi:hypothetical protein
MWRLLKAMGWGVVLGLFIVYGTFFLFAQTTSPLGSSLGFNSANPGPCQSPMVGFTIPCFTTPSLTNPTGIMLSLNGAPYVTLNSLLPAGVQGPAGPTGATGATGPQGIQGLQGPAGALPTTFTCDISIAIGGKATLSNCK